MVKAFVDYLMIMSKGVEDTIEKAVLEDLVVTLNDFPEVANALMTVGEFVKQLRPVLLQDLRYDVLIELKEKQGVSITQSEAAGAAMYAMAARKIANDLPTLVSVH